MENATKALLIAAAVLIVILIIALGVRLLGSVGDTSSQAQTASDEISNASDEAIANLQISLNNGSKDYTYSLLNKYVNASVSSTQHIKASEIKNLLKAIEKYNISASDQIFVNYRLSGKNTNQVTTHNFKTGHGPISKMYTTEMDTYINQVGKENATYKISVSTECNSYPNGKTPEGLWGCITIKEEKSRN